MSNTGIESIWRNSKNVAVALAVVSLFACTAVAIASVVIATQADPSGNDFTAREHSGAHLALIVSSLGFLLTSALVLFRPRLAYTVALFAGPVAFACFLWIEWSHSPWENSWIALNLPGRLPAKLTILAVALIVISTVLSAFRLLPEIWMVRKSPVRERTWPAFAVCALVLVVWFVFSVTPYRLPGRLHVGVGPDLRILHVEKRGLHFHEIEISLFKDGKFSTWQTNRRLFQYRFAGHGGWGVMPGALHSRAGALTRSLSKSVRTPPAKALRAWNADGWYVVASESLLTFTSEYRSQPPRETLDLFEAVRSLPVIQAFQMKTERDVCLGFCYDPVAALGFVYENHHCRTDENGMTRCR
jgi:hypothetical protein